MTLLLAQVSLDQLGPVVPWLAGFSLALFLLNQAITFWKEHLREQPSPANTYARRDELEQVKNEAHGRIKRERAEIDKAIADVRAEYRDTSQRIDAELVALREQLATNNDAGELRAEKLHNRINAVLEASAEMRGELRSFLAAQHRG